MKKLFICLIVAAAMFCGNLALGNVPGVKSVNLSRYEGGEGTFTLHYSGAPETLFSALQAATDADLTLLSSNYNVMAISID